MTGRSVPPDGEAAAIADRLAREIKQHRLDAGMSQRVLAGKIGYSRQYVSMAEWADGNLPSRELVAAIDSVVGAVGSLNRLRSVASDTQRAIRSTTRRLVNSPSSQEVTGAGDIHSIRSGDSQNTSELLEVLGRIQRLSRSVDPEVVTGLAAHIHQVIESYETVDAAKLVGGFVNQRRWIEALLEDCGNTGQRQQLFETAAQTSGLLGFIYVGSGEFTLARAYSSEAFQLSGLAESPNTQAWARGMQSYCEYYAGRYDEALGFARDGLGLARGGP
ncbi:helix-turn-helix domain-containing protein [Nocardia sp. NBC_01329]|uniref:helix-turn-helix domain-containing protein n=1 Tax=Nocardia sp. NBC_01329 TaxID=2903594 RepID=UPI002E16385A|nr:helix-turn-helix domain-containing protein [Nocardia sp. NBC_01329]